MRAAQATVARPDIRIGPRNGTAGFRPGQGRSRRAANRGKGPARGQPCAAASSASRGARDTLSRVQRRPVRQRRHGAGLAPQRSSMAVTLRPAHGRSRPQATAGAALAGSHSGLPQRFVPPVDVPGQALQTWVACIHTPA